MEKRIYNDNFEQFLKETVDDFRMYPSKKVWHSIYNDIHPAKKWPSLAVLLLLVSSLMFIGVNNTNKGVMIADIQNDNTANPFILEEMPTGRTIPANTLSRGMKKGNSIAASGQPSDYDRTTGKKTALDISNDENPLSFIRGNLAELSADENEEFDLGLTGLVGERELRDHQEKQGRLARMMATNPVEESKKSVKDKAVVDKTSSELSLEEKEWMENDAFQNKKKKGKGLFAYQFYATPSVGFRSLSKNTDYEPANPAASMLSNTNAEESQLAHSSAVNIETGANVLYRLSPVFRIKAGIQLNYTNYHINAYSLHHPTLSNLLLNNMATMQPVLVSRMTALSTQPNNGEMQNLNNNTYQFSLPVGADFKLAGNSKMQWFAGATIQPTFITGGNAYLISADRKNYVADPTMLRKFNMNGGIETFISYKVRNGLTFNAGPQIRYQLMSSYEDQYTYDEKLYNIGLKLGITTTF